jgi:transcriptional regulator with XRE-family HTH domain
VVKLPSFNKLVGDRVRFFRKLKGWTQENLAEKSGLQYTYIGGVERGTRNISLKTLGKIINALNIPPHEIFLFDQVDENNELIDKKRLMEMLTSLLAERDLVELELVQKTVRDIFELIDSQKKK